jgi:hypothetical protein
MTKIKIRRRLTIRRQRLRKAGLLRSLLNKPYCFIRTRRVMKIRVKIRRRRLRRSLMKTKRSLVIKKRTFRNRMANKRLTHKNLKRKRPGSLFKVSKTTS